MTPAERRAKSASEADQQKQASKAKQQAKDRAAEQDKERLSFEKEKLAQRRSEYAARQKQADDVKARMQDTLQLKKDEAQRKRDKAKAKAEDNKKARLERDKKNAEAAVKDRTAGMKKLEIGFDNVEKDDGLGTAFSKFGGNITQAGQKVARGTTAFLKRELKDRPALRKAKRKLDQLDKPQKKKPEPKPEPSKEEPAQKVKAVQKVSTPKPKAKALPPASAQKALPPGRSQKALPAARTKSLPPAEKKSLPAAKSAPEKKELPPKTVDQANNQRAAKRAQTTSAGDYESKADRIAAFKKRRAADKAAGVKMREEFLQEVEKMKKEKVDKVINILKGKKNKIETMPKVDESTDWRDNYIPTEFETTDIIKPEPLKPSNWRKDIEEASAAWTRKSGKNKSGGLNEKGRKSYERENPGSDLKRPSKKVGNPRRKSFCARMKGMKKKLTSSKTARDPDSRINKSLRAWNC
tara:strand:- start:230 stop:1630 length:1401 start_codon:yes stop_codon:yes gene_type:complete